MTHPLQAQRWVALRPAVAVDSQRLALARPGIAAEAVLTLADAGRSKCSSAVAIVCPLRVGSTLPAVALRDRA